MPDPSSTPPSPPPSPSPRPLAYRSRHRRASDTEAHEAGHGALVPAVLDHPLVPAGEPVMVGDQASLDRLIATLRATDAFGYDSEFIGEQTYHPWLCLIQVATADGVWLIDPFGDGAEGVALRLESFWELIADPQAHVIVHAGQQDLAPIVRHLGRAPASVFDTQVAAAFTGFRYPISLDTLAEELAGADLGHGAKFSQWDRRPLTDLQRAYAANDVRYLPLLHRLLVDRLAALGNTGLAAAACGELCETRRYLPDPQSRKIKARGVGALSGRRQAVLRSLVAWREDAAQAADVPPRSMLSDPLLYDLAVGQPADLEALGGFKGLPRPVRRDHGQAILEAIGRGQSASAMKPWRPTRAQRETAEPIVEELWPGVEERCRGRGIDPAVVTSKRTFAQHVTLAVAGRVDPAETPIRRGYRQGLLGDLVDRAEQLAAEAEPQPRPRNKRRKRQPKQA